MPDIEDRELIEIIKKNLDLMKECKEVLEDINNVNKILDSKEA